MVTDGGVPCWLIQNSWGTDYGVGGFCFLPIDRYPLLEAWTAD